MVTFEILVWWLVFLAAAVIVAGLAYNLHNLQTRRNLRSAQTVASVKTPRATSQLAVGIIRTPALLTMMNGATGGVTLSPSILHEATTPTSATALLSSSPTLSPSFSHNEENLQTTTTSTTAPAPAPAAILNKRRIATPTALLDSPAIPSVVEVLKAHGSARDRLLQRRQQLLVKKKQPRRKKLEYTRLTPRRRTQQDSDTLRKMR